MQGSSHERVTAWAIASGLSSTTSAIEDDLSRIERARTRRDLPGTKIECDLIAGDVRNANGELPTPDISLTDQLSAAYDALIAGASKCFDAASTSDQASLAEAWAALSRGRQQLEAAQAAATEAGSGHR